MGKKYRKNHIWYSIMLLTFGFIIVWLGVHYEGTALPKEKNANTREFSKGWKTETGESATLKKLNKLEGVEPYEQFSVYNVLPENLPEGLSLCFRSKNIFYQVYIDGNLIYEPYVPESIFYNESFGTRWNYIDLLSEYAGKQIEIRVTTVYEDSRASIDNIYLGSPVGIALNTMQEKMVAFVTCMILLFVGLLLVVADIPINMKKEKNHELLYLGMFTISIAIWCTAETNLLQFFVGDSRLLQFISCFSLVLIPIPMVLYLDSAFGFKKKWLVPTFSILSFGEFLLCMLLHLLKVADLHDTLKLSHCMLAMSAAVLFFTIIKNSFVKAKSQSKNIYRMLRGIGLSGISIAAVIDIVRFYRGTGNDTALFVRIGLLIFVLCYGSSSLEKTINAVKLGVQTEFVSQLAYRDGLTGIGNRTAFEEHLIELEKIKNTVDGIGIIMFDVNDLKYVNDNLGHHLGDGMLVQSAEIIKEAFQGPNSDCFRIGGDEFAVLMSGNNVIGQIEKYIGTFHELVNEYNQEKDCTFRISIACGYAVYSKGNENLKLMDVYQRADMLMYENKRIIKAKQISPEEYYHLQAKE